MVMAIETAYLVLEIPADQECSGGGATTGSGGDQVVAGDENNDVDMMRLAGKVLTQARRLLENKLRRKPRLSVRGL